MHHAKNSWWGRPCFLTPFLVASLLPAGCTTLKTISADQKTPGKVFDRSRVYLRGGEAYDFRRVAFFPDTLVGEVKVQAEKHSDEHGLYFEDEIRALRIPLNTIDSVAVIRTDAGKTLLYAAGLGALAVVIADLVGNGSIKSTAATSDGKAPPSSNP